MDHGVFNKVIGWSMVILFYVFDDFYKSCDGELQNKFDNGFFVHNL